MMTLWNKPHRELAPCLRPLNLPLGFALHVLPEYVLADQSILP